VTPVARDNNPPRAGDVGDTPETEEANTGAFLHALGGRSVSTTTLNGMGNETTDTPLGQRLVYHGFVGGRMPNDRDRDEGGKFVKSRDPSDVLSAMDPLRTLHLRGVSRHDGLASQDRLRSSPRAIGRWTHPKEGHCLVEVA
jgi:hypothetical protein